LLDTKITVALRQALEERGSLRQIKARMRAEIFNALDDKDDPKPLLSNANLLINELIREYLEFNHYRHTLSVLLPESGQPEQAVFDHGFMARELNLDGILRETGQASTIPLIYSIVALLQQSQPPVDAREQS